MKPALEILSLGKEYRIQHLTAGYLSLREKIVNALKFEKVSTENFWALKDISFTVEPGESIGIIGRNGAGKSTLLKILSKITPPTTGKVVARGRVASLLEVGTGFHPELSGRENIFFNGSLLGMRNREIQNKFDEIVDFSGVERFLDTPLKHFSSGMQLRLAFAVAAFLENEILIVDEVLAVGDAEFQKKCFRKMGEVTKNGRTVLFVSHNLPSLKALCQKGILLEKGMLSMYDSIDAVVNAYSFKHESNRRIMDNIKYFRQFEKINSISLNGSDNNTIVLTDRRLSLLVDITFSRKTSFELQVHLKKDDFFICSYANFVRGEIVSFEGRYLFNYSIEFPEVRSGKYKLDIYFTEPFVTWFANIENEIEIEFINENHNVFLNSTPFNWWGTVLLKGNMEFEQKMD
jgi:ABC-type polysaccharide/polyol phosphate transport system ATPase subunit